MVPKLNRLTKKKDFDIVFKKGKSLRSGFLIFKSCKNDLQKTRIGFVVSKKVSNKATVRNKIKRRLRVAALQEIKKQNEPRDIVVVVLPEGKDKDFSQIREAVSKAVKNLK